MVPGKQGYYENVRDLHVVWTQVHSPPGGIVPVGMGTPPASYITPVDVSNPVHCAR